MNEMVSPRFSLPLTLTALLAACGGGNGESAAAQADGDGKSAAVQSAERIVACDLITSAEAETILGSISYGPDADEGKFRGMNASNCSFLGTKGMIIVKVWHPYSGGESSSSSWAAKVGAERESAPTAGLEELSAVGKITPYEGLGVPTAIEDSRADIGMVELHASKGGKGGVYLAVTAPDPGIAIAVAEKALARLP